MLKSEYQSHEKKWPFVGSNAYKNVFAKGSRHYYNSLAVFPNQQAYRMHGTVGLSPDGTAALTPASKPPPITNETRIAALANGGFYQALSDHLPLDRDPPDFRPPSCRAKQYNIEALEDVSVIITFYNEPLSSLLRTVHAVLNRTPPPILREIILVDDSSSFPTLQEGGFLDSYVNLLPKVKILRLPERRGIVTARLVGARVAAAPILVILDSHVEVNDAWLEPQLQHLAQSPSSIVFPQIFSINSETFEYVSTTGIGCTLGFSWNMVEIAYPPLLTYTEAAVPSPSMAGGLFAVRADWFWELGGFDEQFEMWGAENVEMGFRVWMCGGRLECASCSSTFHIFRNHGTGYESPPSTLAKNRLRTARLWTDEYYQISQKTLSEKTKNIGSLDRMLALKEKLHCRPFQWYIDHVASTHNVSTLDDVLYVGSIQNRMSTKWCIDAMGKNKAKEGFEVFSCHNQGGNQSFFYDKTKQIHTPNIAGWCIGPELKAVRCDHLKEGFWDVLSNGQLVWTGSKSCLTLELKDNEAKLKLMTCDDSNEFQRWNFTPFVKDAKFELPQFSERYKFDKKLSSRLSPSI